jgi:glycosyltransferase involved in cell wall biosynthesis
VLAHSYNLGYGAALQTGYIHAIDSGYDILVQLDSDGQHSIESVQTLLEPIQAGSADMVIGSRHLSPGNTGMPAIRRLGQKIFSTTIRLFGGPWMSDPTSGFQAMNTQALRLFSDDVFPCDYPDSDVILMAHYAGLRITEVPAIMLPRTGGTSLHSGLSPLYYGIKMLFSMIIVYLNRTQWRILGQSLSQSPRTFEPETPDAA